MSRTVIRTSTNKTNTLKLIRLLVAQYHSGKEIREAAAATTSVKSITRRQEPKKRA
jgi:hypothetical protein